MNDLIMETSMATPQKINPASPPAQSSHLAALKAAMVMGPTPKSEVKSPEQTNSFPTTVTSPTTTASTTAASSSPTTTITTTVTPSKPTITTTVTIKSSSNTVLKDEKPTASPRTSTMDAKNQLILNPPKNNNNKSNNSVKSSSSSAAGSAAGPTIGNLIAGMDAIRQEAINSDKEIGFTSPSAVSGVSSSSASTSLGGVHPVGKDVSTVIGRIAQVKGLTTTGVGMTTNTTTTTTTPTTAGAAAAATTTPAPIPRSRINSAKPQTTNDGEKTAHEFSVGGSRATPPPSKTENSSRSRVTSARARGSSATTTTNTSHKVTGTVSETTNTTTADGSSKKSPTKSSAPFSTSTRPATTSATSATSSSANRTTIAARRISNSNNDTSSSSSKVKTTKSFSAIKTHPKMGDAAAAGDSAAAGAPAEKGTLKDQFAVFSRFGDTSSDGKQISLTNSDKWMKQAGVIGPKSITTTDTSIYFKKLFKTAKKVSFEDYKKFLEDLAASKKIEVQEIHDKMINCGHPATSSATKAAHAGVVERLTDTSKYTGSHKERFDSTGRGRGIDGRRDTKDASGYTAAFKSKLGTEGGKNGSSSPSPTPPSK